VTTGKNKFVFVAPMYNASQYVGQMLHSICAQSYDNWQIILIDDCSSQPEQIASQIKITAFQELLHKFGDDKEKIKVIWNSEGRGKQWEVSNVLHGISMCQDDDIIVRIDADDWLTEIDALSILDNVYTRTDVEALWTAHRWGMSDKNISGPLPVDANVYKHPWVSSHLKTFRKRLINNVKDENFRDETGNYFRRIGDQAIYLPVLRNTKKRVFLPRCFYHYTINDIPETYQTSDAVFQRDEALFLRHRGYIE